MKSEVDVKYLELCDYILKNGELHKNRTGVDTIRIFGHMIKLDISDYKMPLLTTKKINFDKIISENLWFMRGDNNIKFLKDNNNNIWNSWANEDGDLGRMYPENFRAYKGIRNGEIIEFDQINYILNQIRTNSKSRRIMFTSFDPVVVPDGTKLPQEHISDGYGSLAPCHGLIVMLNVNLDDTLSCIMFQRSADVPIGLPFNIAGYALLTHMFAEATGKKAKELTVMLGDTHIYVDQIEGIQKQITQEMFETPTIKFNKKFTDPNQLEISDIELLNYKSSKFIKMPVAI